MGYIHALVRKERNFITLSWAHQPLSSNWQISFQVKTKIIPVLYKGDDETDPSNYRPISLLSVFNRIFEKVMYNRLKSYIEDNELLYKAQYGFRETFSTQHAILDIVSMIQTNMEKKMFTCGIFLDFKKAFDTVNRTILFWEIAPLWD